MRSYLPHSHFPIFVEGKQGDGSLFDDPLLPLAR